MNVCFSVWVCMHMHALWHVHGGQRTTLRNWFRLSCGSQLSLSGLPWPRKSRTQWAISLAQKTGPKIKHAQARSHFLMGLFMMCSTLNLESVLQILTTNQLGTWFANILSHSAACLLIPLPNLSQDKSCMRLNWQSFLIFDVRSKKSLSISIS